MAAALAGTKDVAVTASGVNGLDKSFRALMRIDTPKEVAYYRHGGILEYVLRQLAGLGDSA